MSNKKNKNKNKNKNRTKQIGEKTLKLQDLQDFTVGEIVEQSKRVDQENQDNESVLDKYIRQHRGEIEEAKSKNLDDFIQNEREQIATPDVHSTEGTDNTTELKGTLSSSPEEEKQSVELSETTSEQAEEALKETKVEPERQENRGDSKSSAEDQLDSSDEKQEVILDPVIMADGAISDSSLDDKAPQETKPAVADETEAREDKKAVEDQSSPVSPVIMSANDSEQETRETVTPLVPPQAESQPAGVPYQTVTPSDEAKSEPEVETSQEKVAPVSNKRKVPIIIGLCALVLIAAGAVGFAQYNAHQKPKTVQTSSSSRSDLDNFKSQYEAFFTDKSHEALKNSQFSALPKLEKLVNTHKTATAWASAVSETEDLKTQIAAIEKVNALFTKPAITDGKLDKQVQIVKDVKIPETPKTANATLNKLLAQAIDLAQAQKTKASSSQAAAKASSAAASTSQDKAVASSTAQSATDTGSTTTPSSSAADTSSASQNSGQSSTTNSEGVSSAGVTLETAKARVQPQAGVNTSDPAFTWGAGIKEKVLNIARDRGYITGNDYILVPSAIHTTNGTQGFPAGIVSGYYNLYAPNGTYLVSINAKTGYFVGNGSGHSDNLDY
ncbi:cell division site-positioning protein MapZ family protein [Lactococcus taiwanensis]|uniref:cell division site-positioning protein MapZ family protein n=1 Tax=Lactococcus taiwanensis TaxID=1151742 RepID=UPI001908E804|nr:cell division site-positioning protein MapZ family protein [Lactococcus taiwanensis]